MFHSLWTPGGQRTWYMKSRCAPYPGARYLGALPRTRCTWLLSLIIPVYFCRSRSTDWNRCRRRREVSKDAYIRCWSAEHVHPTCFRNILIPRFLLSSRSHMQNLPRSSIYSKLDTTSRSSMNPAHAAGCKYGCENPAVNQNEAYLIRAVTQ